MMTDPPQTSPDARTVVRPGICGFACTIKAFKIDARTIRIKISASGCEQIKKLEQRLDPITLQALFAPLTRNPVYVAAQQCGCHASCIIPASILKTAEVAMEMALPQAVEITFKPCNQTAK